MAEGNNTYLLHQHGLSLHWNREEAQAVRKGNAVHWELLKTVRGVCATGSIAEHIPEFVPSVERLSRYGYSKTDIATMFGMSRQRLGEIGEQLDIRFRKRHGAAYRVWDETREQFMAVTAKEMAQHLHDAKQEHRGEARDTRIEDVRERDVQELQTLAERLGATPSIRAFAQHLGTSPANVARYWREIGDERAYVDAWDRLYARAGLTRRTQSDVQTWIRQYNGPCASEREEGTLGAYLTEQRLARGLTQAEAAKRVGINPETLRMHEQNKQHPRRRTLRAYGRTYQTPVPVLQSLLRDASVASTASR